MSEDLDDLARAAADALISAMVTDSWKAVMHRFGDLVGRGHQRRMEKTRSELAGQSGPDLRRAQLMQARVWATRLRDVLENNPDTVAGMRGIIAELNMVREATASPTSQQARAGHGSQAVTVGGSISGNTGEVYVGVGKVDKRRFRFVLIPVNFFIHMTRKIVAAHPVTAAATAVVVVGGVVSAGVALAQTTAPALAALEDSWTGTYTCAQGLAGLHLQIGSPERGSVQVALDFYPVPANPQIPQGSATYQATLSGATVHLTPVAWIDQPPGYVFTRLTGALPTAGGDVFSGTIIGSGCTTFSLQRSKGIPVASVVADTWAGIYSCAQGLTGLRLVIQPSTGTKLQATFNFYAVHANPSVPSGSFAMTGFIDPAGMFLDQDRWIKQPPGFEMVNIATALPAAGKTLTGSVVGCSSISLQKS